MEPLKDLQVFKELHGTVKIQSWKFVLVGTGFAFWFKPPQRPCQVHHKSSTLAIWLTFQGALPVLFGDNIWNNILLLSLLWVLMCSQTMATAHVAFSVIGTVICIIFLVPFTGLINGLKLLNLAPAMSHRLWNLQHYSWSFSFHSSRLLPFGSQAYPWKTSWQIRTSLPWWATDQTSSILSLLKYKKNFFTWVIMLQPLTSLTTISSNLMKSCREGT